MRLIDRLAKLLRRTRPQQGSSRWPIMPQRTAGQTVSEDTAMTVSAYWCCVRVIAETISQMPWRVYQKTEIGRKVADQHPADRLLNMAPNNELDAAVWRELMVRWVLTWGNSYSEIVRDTSNRPVALWPIEPWRVSPMRATNGLFYRVQQPQGDPVELPAADVLHFRGLGEELEGWSVIAYMARTLGLAMSQEVSMAAQMENGARLSGLLMPPGNATLGAEKAKKLEKAWNAQNAGSGNHGKVLLMPMGLDFKAIAQPNTDAQLLESRQFSVLDVCRFMRVPPHKVYDLARATFSNITHQSLEFLTDTVGPWIVKLEQQVNRKLISPSMQRSYFSKINSRAILRMDPDTRVKYYQGLRDLGAISPNEVRAEEDLDNLGTDGDLYLVPVNMQTLEKAAAEPEPQQIPIMPEEQEEQPPEDQEEEAEDGRD